jgi:RimJ/RimL family protein N-acetyltransferase
MSFDYPINTHRLSLRPFSSADIDDVYQYHSREDVVQYLYWQPRSYAEVEQLVRERMGLTALSHEGDALFLAVELANQRQMIGELTLIYRSKEHQQGEIGFVFNPEFQGMGYATEASEVLLSIGFETYEFHRIAGRCDARNIASYRVMEKLGMRREAHFIHNEMFKGEWGDELVYAILREEWLQANR